MARSTAPAENLGLAYRAAGKLARKLGCNPDELIGDAYIALCEAQRTFDPSKGCQFSTHAVEALHYRLFKCAMLERGNRKDSKPARLGGKGWTPRLPMVDLGADGQGNAWLDHEPAKAASAGDGRTRADVLDVIAIAEEISPKAGEIVRLLSRGVRQGQAAKIVGVTRQTVTMVLDEIRLRIKGETSGNWSMEATTRPKTTERPHVTRRQAVSRRPA